MIESGDYPTSTEFNPDAPWNQNPEEEDYNNFEPEYENED